MVQSTSSTTNQIERWVKRFKSESHEFRLKLHLHPNIAKALKDGPISRLTRMKLKFRVFITLEEDPKLPIAEFHFISVKQGKDITAQYSSQVQGNS